MVWVFVSPRSYSLCLLMRCGRRAGPDRRREGVGRGNTCFSNAAYRADRFSFLAVPLMRADKSIINKVSPNQPKRPLPGHSSVPMNGDAVGGTEADGEPGQDGALGDRGGWYSES